MIYPSLTIYPSYTIYPNGGWLITDRQLSDVEYAKEVVEHCLSGEATTYEKYDLVHGLLIGLYNFEDMNRVGKYLLQAKEALTSLGIQVTYPYTVKTNWAVGDMADSTKAAEYLANVAALRTVLADYATVPTPPSSMQNFTYISANIIESIISIAFDVQFGAMGEVKYSGDYYLGGN